jgi:hypothetical protein
MSYPGEKIIQELEDLITVAIESFEAYLPDVADEMMERLRGFVASLEKNRLGTIKASVENLRAITRFKAKLAGYMEKGIYGDAVKEYIQAYKQVATVSNKYFSTIVGGFSPKDLYVEIRNQNITTTVETLLDSGLRANYVQPITNILQQSITGQSSVKDLTKSLTDTLNANGQPTKWVKQQTSDSLYQYSRNYTEAVSNDLGLEHYLYAGTQIDTTRAFCKSKVGKVFTKAEVTAWAVGEWSGKIPGTNASNIQIRLGGYHCLHRLLPITEATYRSMLD